MRVREALLEVTTPAAPWLPPDLSALLPDGPVVLESGRFERPSGEGSGEAESVDSDETLDVDGADVGSLHPNLAGIAEQQYAEMKALFLWLSDAAVKSPWQDGLRGS
jgi:hypothetical protein